jgi:hypothetical protein
METFKIVINSCYGGFSLSDEAIAMFRERKGIAADERVTYADELERDDPDLIAVVETLGPKRAAGRAAYLTVVEVPMWLQEKGWEIEEYDGWEHIAEKHQTWF